jgi:hypothetical protein
MRSGQGRARTADTGLFRAVLYQLSYLTNFLRMFSYGEFRLNGSLRLPLSEQQRSEAEEYGSPASTMVVQSEKTNRTDRTYQFDGRRS